MMYLIAQMALFLSIACLIGIVIGHFLVRDQKSEHQAQLESEAHDARNRSIAVEKEIEEYRLRLAELEGLPVGARASRVAAREEVASRMTQLERELSVAQTAEKRLNEESGRLKAEVDAFRSRYLEARAKWDEYKAKADALAAAPAPLNLGVSQIVPDESMRQRVLELEGLLGEAGRERERLAEQMRSLTARSREMERPIANAGQGNATSNDLMKSLQARIALLEASLTTVSRERDGAVQLAQNTAARARELEQHIAKAGAGNEQPALTKSVQARMSELETRVATVERERDGAIQQAQSVMARAQELELQIAHAGKGSEQTILLTNSMQARVSELETSLATTARERDGAVQQAQTVMTRSRELELQIAKAGKGSEQSLLLTQSMQARTGELETSFANATRERDSAVQQAQSLTGRLGELERQLVSAGQGSERSNDAARTLQARVKELEARLATGFSAARESDGLRSRVADLQDKLAEAEVALSKSITVTRQETDPLRHRIAELETRLSALVAAPSAAGTDTLPMIQIADDNFLRTQLAEAEARADAAERRAAEAVRQQTVLPAVDDGALRAQLAQAEARVKAAELRAAEAASLRQRITELESQRPAGNDDETRRLAARNAELEQSLDKERRQAGETQTLRAQIVSLETRLSEALAAADKSGTGEDVGLLKARLADVEQRLMASSQSTMEQQSLRSRVVSLEALLHEAAKSRDEAAVLRSKVAELDGRLGQAMKTMAESRARKPESEAV